MKWGLSPLGHLKLLFDCSWHSFTWDSLVHICSHSYPLESGQIMETAINLQLLLPQYPLLFWKPWLFQASQTLAGVGTAVFNHGALVSMVTAHDQSPASFRCLLQGSKHCICYSFISPTWVFFKPCVYQCLEMSLLG